jgi:formylglycine-generating enzyme required for sulfatase activity
MMRRFASGPEVAKQSLPSIRMDRVALLVGNAAYPGRRLGTPVHDVEVLKGVLNLLRFDVAVVTDATKSQFETAIAQFGERIDATAPAALSFFYFAGHGIQHDTTNYLLPVDIEDISSTRHLPAHAISIEDVVDQIISSNCRENVIILDACRDNPLGGALRLRRAAQGLARLLAPPPGTLIAFSTASGAVAADGDGSNSPYLEALADELLQAPAHATIGDVFHSVSKRLQHRTEQAQSPALYIQGHLETVIRPWADLLPDAAVGAKRAFVRVSVGLGDQPDQVRAMIPGTGLNQWFKDFQHGPEMVIVPPGSFLMGGDGDNQTPEHDVTIAEPFAVSRFAITVAQFASFIKESGYRPVARIWTFEAEFDIGAYGDGYSGGQPPPRQREDRSFRRPGFPQASDHPVVGISWNDAKKYVEWLSAKTGKSYRLLSEAEWEYVARAGSTTRFWWGDSTKRRQANYDFHEFQSWDARSWRYRRGKLSWWLRQKLTWRPAWGLSTAPVDVCDPNGWGLFNVHGNVMEWVEDAWHGSYAGAPRDGSAWLSTPEEWKVVRGGAWCCTSDQALTSSAREANSSERGDNWTGFRVARTLSPARTRS